VRILLLCHRIPYPPDKGDKIRSFHLLEALCRHHDVRLIAHADDPADVRHVPELRKRCRSVSVHPVRRGQRMLTTAAALASGRPLSFARFHDGRAEREVREALRTDAPDVVVVFSAQPASYLPDDLDVPVLVDLVDVDSEKWASYAGSSRGLMRHVFERESRLVRDFERRLAARGFRISLATEREARLFRRVVADARVDVVENGVEVGAPLRDGAGTPGLLVFTGAMDYEANRAAATIGARDVLPLIRQRVPDARFRIVGRNPGRAVRALARLPGVDVAGEVPSVVDELDRAAVSLLPLQTVRGVPNKMLESFARGIPVVATKPALEAVGAKDGEHALGSDSPEGLAQAATSLLLDRSLAARIGAAGRDLASGRFRWDRFESGMLGLVEEAAHAAART
jgi:sugar transferase (PEP-CTERM/EpsH1 system associated)